ncbi:MAG TPA: hypothetical protein IAA19_01750 [Candidatus Olsenella pullistercoris]|uniref:Uncharacterized protein n=1 Tax=Candidatus Olsenella pullistercoris TaxID=2838712 RepID=A0A9D2JEH9_9ACTN|nr:hypothetical protein [Candidatus Olsenella pullistercoris]
MFTDEDKKLIRRLYLWPKLGSYFLLAIFPTLAAWVILIMIDDIALESRGAYEAGLFALLPIVIVYLVISMVLLVRSRHLAGSEEWARVERAALVSPVDASTPGELHAALGLAATGRVAEAVGERQGDKNLEGLGETAQAAAGALGILGVWLLARRLHEAARHIAEGHHLPMPGLAPRRLAVFLAPVVVLAIVFAPRFASSAAAMSQAQQAASDTLAAVEAAFEEGGCGYVSVDDPSEGYQSYGYRAYGYTLDIGDPGTSSLCVSTDEDGVVETLDFHTDFDLSLIPEENLARAERDFELLSGMVSGLDVPVVANGLLAAEPTFPEEFVERFCAGSYYDDLIVRYETADGLRVTVSYETDPEDEYDEYSSSYVYLTFSAE